MTKQRIYKKSKISRVVEKAQRSITGKHSSYATVYFEEWYMMIRDNRLVVNIPYVVISKNQSTYPVKSVHFETV